MIRAMCGDEAMKVGLKGRKGNAFSVGVGVHRGSVLSPLLFIIVLGALSRVQGGSACGVALCRWSCFGSGVGGIVDGGLRRWRGGWRAGGGTIEENINGHFKIFFIHCI